MADANSRKPIRARAYIRVSRVGERELQSDKVQMEEARRVCERMGWTLDEATSNELMDLDVSGFTKSWDRRKGLKQHYKDAANGTYDVLIVYRTDRYGRSTVDTIHALKAFRARNVRVFSGSENYFLDAPESWLQSRMTMLMAEQESRNTSARILKVKEFRAKEGGFHGGNPPQWIKRIKEDNGAKSFVVVPHVADAIRRLVALRLSGCSYRTIERTLNAEGFTTITGSVWTISQVVKYTRPEWVDAMVGYTWFRREGRHKIDRDSGQRVSLGEPIRSPKPIFPPIIDDATADQMKAMYTLIRERFEERGDMGGYKPEARTGRYNAESDYILSGAIWCAICGKRLTSHKKLNEKVYWCQPDDLGVPHVRRTVETSNLEDAVLRVLRYLIERLPEAEKPAKGTTHRSRKAGRSMSDIDAAVDRLVQLQIAGRIKEEDYDRAYGALVKDREALMRPIEEVDALVLLDTLKSEVDITRAQLKQMVLSLVERVEWPIFDPRAKLRSDEPRVCARVTLRYALGSERIYVAPLYTNRWQHKREVYLAE